MLLSGELQEQGPYITNASGKWVKTTVASVGEVVHACSSIAVDSNDKVHISYDDWTNGSLKYATNASGVWVSTNVDSPGSVGWGNSIALDSSNKVHISYVDMTNGNLKYATDAY